MICDASLRGICEIHRGRKSGVVEHRSREDFGFSIVERLSTSYITCPGLIGPSPEGPCVTAWNVPTGKAASVSLPCLSRREILVLRLLA